MSDATSNYNAKWQRFTAYWDRARKMEKDKADFFKALFEGQSGYVEYLSLTNKIINKKVVKDVTDRHFFDSLDLDFLDQIAQYELSGKADCYFGVALRLIRRGLKSDVKAIVALWADVDYGEAGHKQKPVYATADEARAAIRERLPAHMQPSIIVDSGGGLHLYWLLREPEPMDMPESWERVENIMRVIADCLGGDHAQNINHILRIPGTFNNKITDDPRPCSIIHLDTNARFNLADFDFLADAPKSISQNKAPKQATIAVRELAPQFKEIISTGKVPPYKSRSERDQAVICALVNSGRSDAQIFEIFENNVIGDKFREMGINGEAYLKISIKKARATSGKPNIDREKLLSDFCELSKQFQIYRLSGRESQIFHTVVNETIVKGFKSKWMTGSYLAKALGIHRSDCHTVITGLVEKKVLKLKVVGEKAYNKEKYFRINWNFSEWR